MIVGFGMRGSGIVAFGKVGRGTLPKTPQKRADSFRVQTFIIRPQKHKNGQTLFVCRRSLLDGAPCVYSSTLTTASIDFAPAPISLGETLCNSIITTYYNEVPIF